MLSRQSHKRAYFAANVIYERLQCRLSPNCRHPSLTEFCGVFADAKSHLTSVQSQAGMQINLKLKGLVSLCQSHAEWAFKVCNKLHCPMYITSNLAY